MIEEALEEVVILDRLERYREIIDDWQAFEEAHQRILRPSVWTNTLRLAPEDLHALLLAEGMEPEPLDWYEGGFRLPARLEPRNRGPGKTVAYLAGLYHVQEEVSMMPVVLLDPQPDERILDLCAAPGNKTVQMSVLMNDTGTVIANDMNRGRVGLVVRATTRLGVSNVSLMNEDGGNLPRDIGLFDRVLADVPCSCEGTARRHPQILYRLEELHDWRTNTQVALLRKAIQRVRPGGRVVYSTCTYAPEENEVVVDAVLRELPEGSVKILPATLPGIVSSPGLREWQGKEFLPEIEKAMRVYPHQNDTGGSFMIVLERNPEATT